MLLPLVLCLAWCVASGAGWDAVAAPGGNATADDLEQRHSREVDFAPLGPRPNATQDLRQPMSCVVGRREKANRTRHGLVVCALVRDEAPFLREWLAYHAVAGVDHVYVYDDGSSDGWRAAVAPFAALGFVMICAILGIPCQCHTTSIQMDNSDDTGIQTISLYDDLRTYKYQHCGFHGVTFHSNVTIYTFLANAWFYNTAINQSILCTCQSWYRWRY